MDAHNVGNDDDNDSQDKMSTSDKHLAQNSYTELTMKVPSKGNINDTQYIHTNLVIYCLYLNID